jgi:hypothetical protein
MKKVRMVLLVIGYLAIAVVLVTMLLNIDIGLVPTLLMAIGGPAIILTDAAITFARQPGLSRKNFLGKFLVWIYTLAFGFLVGYGIIDIIFKLVEGYEGSFATPIIMLSVGIAMFIVFIIIIARKDPDVKKELAIAKTDERVIANNHKAHYHTYYVLLAAMIIFAAIVGLIPITGTAIIVGGIIGICVLSFVLACVLYFRYDKNE